MEQQPSRNRQQTSASASEQRTERRSSYLRSGVVAGAVSAFVFTLVHDLFISDIWDMLIVMVVAGAVCGLCIGWTYGRLVEVPSIGSWVGYNLVYLAMFGLLGAGSLLILVNYLGVLPGGTSNVYLLVGLGLILGSIIAATQWR